MWNFFKYPWWKSKKEPEVKTIKTNPMLITADQLRKITPSLKGQRADDISLLLNDLCVKYGITDKEVFKMFLANVAQESGEFAHKEENMNYSAKRIPQVWPSRFPTIAAAEPYARNPEKLANFVYGNRMGNTEPGDGHQYKGGGFIGITGKELYTKYAKFIGKDVKLASELIRTTDLYAMDSACWFFAKLKNLIPVAMKGDFKAVVKGINGGFIGLVDRETYYARVKKILG